VTANKELVLVLSGFCITLVYHWTSKFWFVYCCRYQNADWRI